MDKFLFHKAAHSLCKLSHMTKPSLFHFVHLVHLSSFQDPGQPRITSNRRNSKKFHNKLHLLLSPSTFPPPMTTIQCQQRLEMCSHLEPHELVLLYADNTRSAAYVRGSRRIATYLERQVLFFLFFLFFYALLMITYSRYIMPNDSEGNDSDNKNWGSRRHVSSFRWVLLLLIHMYLFFNQYCCHFIIHNHLYFHHQRR